MKPILFGMPMVQAILAERKTQTRRVIKPQPSSDMILNTTYLDGTLEFKRTIQPDPLHDYAKFLKVKPRYHPGDILWVRETWGEDKHNWLYMADFSENDLFKLMRIMRWRPSIHMPRAAARIFLRVTDVRVERVQEISEEDAIAEGCEGMPCDHSMGRYACEDCMNSGWREPPQLEFMELWEQINAKRGYGWDKNPWVWVYTFKQITKEEAEVYERPF